MQMAVVLLTMVHDVDNDRGGVPLIILVPSWGEGRTIYGLGRLMLGKLAGLPYHREAGFAQADSISASVSHNGEMGAPPGGEEETKQHVKNDLIIVMLWES